MGPAPGADRGPTDDAGDPDRSRPGRRQIPLVEPAVGAKRIVADVAGPVCESGDFLAEDRELADVEPGDLLAVMSAGGYGAVQAGTYNTRALIPEVLVRDDAWALVRPRIEVEALIRLDRLPPWLEGK